MRRAAKVDTNQSALIAVARRIGASVQPLHTVGKGCPDLLIGWRGQNYLVEIKDGSKPPSKRRLTPDEAHWHAAWRGQVAVVDSEHALLALLRATAS